MPVVITSYAKIPATEEPVSPPMRLTFADNSFRANLVKTSKTIQQLAGQIERSNLRHNSSAKGVRSSKLTDLTSSHYQIKKDLGQIARLVNDLIKYHNQLKTSGHIDHLDISKKTALLAKIDRKLAGYITELDVLEKKNTSFSRDGKKLPVNKQDLNTFHRRTEKLTAKSKELINWVRSSFSDKSQVEMSGRANQTSQVNPRQTSNPPELISRFRKVVSDALNQLFNERAQIKMQEVQFLLQNAHDRSLINRVRVGGFVNMYPNKETIDSNQVPDVEKRLEQRQQAARILLDVAKPTQEAERLFRSRIVEIIRDKLAGTSFVLEDQVPKEVRLAAIPAEKKDSLISFKTLVSKLPNIMSLPGADGVSLLNKVDGSFEVMRERSILKLVNLDNARVRVVIVKDGIETRIGTAWNDDAMILATRFASGRDLGISKGQQPANREYYIPTKDFLANNE